LRAGPRVCIAHRWCSHRHLREEEERTVVQRCQSVRLCPVCGRRLLRERLPGRLPKLRLARLARAVRGCSGGGSRSSQDLHRRRQGVLWGQWRLRRQGCVSALSGRHRMWRRRLRPGSVHGHTHLQSSRAVCGASFAHLQPVCVQWTSLLFELHEGHRLRHRNFLRGWILRKEGERGRLQCCRGMSVGLLCARRVLQLGLYGRLQGLQSRCNNRAVHLGFRWLSRSAGAMQGNCPVGLRNLGYLLRRIVCLRRERASVQGRSLRQYIVGDAGLHLRRSWRLYWFARPVLRNIRLQWLVVPVHLQPRQ